jgi:hypothetical protein
MSRARRWCFTLALAAGVGPLAGCATTTWTLTKGECIGDQVESEEYDAYALYLRTAFKDSTVVITHTTLTEEPLPESALAAMPEKERQRFRELAADNALRSFADAGPAWQQAGAPRLVQDPRSWPSRPPHAVNPAHIPAL